MPDLDHHDGEGINVTRCAKTLDTRAADVRQVEPRRRRRLDPQATLRRRG
jgi:hypothetical protein